VLAPSLEIQFIRQSLLELPLEGNTFAQIADVTEDPSGVSARNLRLRYRPPMHDYSNALRVPCAPQPADTKHVGRA